jgi:hypothetical protein
MTEDYDLDFSLVNLRSKNQGVAMAGALGWIVLLVCVWLAGQAYSALRANKSEGARRIKVVLAWSGATVVAWVLFMIGGPGLVAIALVVIATVWWVAKGFKK